MIKLLLILLIITIIFFVIMICIKIIKKEKLDFERYKKPGKAKIVGYDSESSSNHVIFSVKILGIDDEHYYNLQGVYNVKKPNGQLDTSKVHFNIGDEVYVYYAPIKQFGIKMLSVKLDDDKYIKR